MPGYNASNFEERAHFIWAGQAPDSKIKIKGLGPACLGRQCSCPFGNPQTAKKLALRYHRADGNTLCSAGQRAKIHMRRQIGHSGI